MSAYNFAFLDEQTKRMIRRAVLKAVAIPGFQVPFAERIKREVGILTQAVGLIRDPDFAEQILQDGRADLIAVGREALLAALAPPPADHRRR